MGLLWDMFVEVFVVFLYFGIVDLRDFNFEIWNWDNGFWWSYGVVILEKLIGLRLEIGVDNG